MSRRFDGATATDSGRCSADRLAARGAELSEAARRHEALKKVPAAPGGPAHPRRGGSGRRSRRVAGGVQAPAAGSTVGEPE